MDLLKLNFPEIEPKIKQIKSEWHIWDVCRKKYLLLTPEEWVRQHALHFLHSQLKYPFSLTKTESAHTLNKLRKRTDILIFNNKAEVVILVECKAAEVKINQKVVEQALVYNQTINAVFIYLTNGFQHIFLKKDEISSTYHQINHLPAYL